ncbi:MAG: hypothetical protein Q7R41_06370, partial [Phycisphaerales bacterium]|nr:hypothetical protein [Phycisphaerales bacterium]
MDQSSEEKIVVEIKSVDVYDPTTGEIRSSSTDDMACGVIDTPAPGASQKRRRRDGFQVVLSAAKNQRSEA